MARDLDLPVVLRMKSRNKLLLLAIGLLLAGYGIHLVGEQSMVRVPVFGRVSATTFGYFAAAIGTVLAIASVQAFVTERPKLILEAGGLVFIPNFGAARHLAWVEIAAVTLYSNRYDSGVEIWTRGSQRLKIPAIEGSAEDMRDLMLRCADAAAARIDPA